MLILVQLHLTGQVWEHRLLILFIYFLSQLGYHCNETIAGGFWKSIRNSDLLKSGKLCWTSLEAEPQTTSFYVPIQDKDFLKLQI